MLKIAIHEPMPLSAVSFYRSIGTFSFLPKINKNIQITTPKTISWAELTQIDLFYMERPQEDSDITALKLAKDFNIPIWVDYDDCLHEVPPFNPSYDFYTKTHALKNVEKAMELADVMTVSTPALKEYYSKFNKNIHVIENAHNDYKMPFEKVIETKNIINWRGSNTHREDLLSIKKFINDIETKNKEWVWNWTGSDLWYITDYMNPETTFNKVECDIIEYFKFIKDIKSAIQIIPLKNIFFNHTKSNIAWIEGTFAGSCCICPDFPEFQRPGAVLYSEEKENFGYLMEKIIKSKSFREKNYLKSFEFIKENLLLSEINKKRLEIIERIM